MGLSRGSYPDWPKEMISFAPESDSKEVLFATFGDPWDLVNLWYRCGSVDPGFFLGVQKHHLNLHTYKLELPPHPGCNRHHQDYSIFSRESL